MIERGVTPMNVRCAVCAHVWAPVYLPAPMDEVAQILKAGRCPKCGSASDHHFIAPDASMGAK